MQSLKRQLSLLLVICAAVGGSLVAGADLPVQQQAGEAQNAGAKVESHGAKEEHGLPEAAVPVLKLGWLTITNSMIVTWVVAAGLIVFVHFATRRMERVPSGAQNFLEWLVESLYGFLEGIIGAHLVKRTFWFFATIFIFILSLN